MEDWERKALKLFETATSENLKFAASEAIGHYNYEEFCKHTGVSAGESGFYYPKVRRVEQLSGTMAKLHFYKKYFLFGNKINPFVISIKSISNKLEVIYALNR